jgi:MurNAc alpha-1-phosphate uridylyltransferase
MATTIKQAMILAAGFGKRMGALTCRTPKPLIQIHGHRLIEYHLYGLAQANIERVIINVSYLSDKIMNTLGNGQRYGLNIIYSIEKDGPLGVDQGIEKALPMLNQQPFLLLAADIWSDIDIANLCISPSSPAHCLLVSNPSFYHQGDFSLKDNGQLAVHTPAPLTYAGIAALDPIIWREKAASFKQRLNQVANTGKATGEIHHGHWFNVGSAQQIRSLKRHLVQRSA